MVTGETGAGKTMLVEAIELLVGGRADTTVVRHGTDEARVDGRFITADGDELVLSRVIARNGRSRAYLNGRLATVASLTEATAGLVDLHGQHAHQSLLSTATQRPALDRFGDVDLAPLRGGAGATHRDRRRVGSARRRRAGAGRERSTCSVTNSRNSTVPTSSIADEDARLDAEETLLGDAVAYREAGELAVASLVGDEDGGGADGGAGIGGARDALAAALGALEGRLPYADAAERLHGVLSEVDDVVAEVRRARRIDRRVAGASRIDP